MDVHNLQEATALQVEQHHAADLAEQGNYGVTFLKYWFNESQGKGFCLVDAPSAEAVQLLYTCLPAVRTSLMWRQSMQTK